MLSFLLDLGYFLLVTDKNNTPSPKKLSELCHWADAIKNTFKLCHGKPCCTRKDMVKREDRNLHLILDLLLDYINNPHLLLRRFPDFKHCLCTRSIRVGCSMPMACSPYSSSACLVFSTDCNMSEAALVIQPGHTNAFPLLQCSLSSQMGRKGTWTWLLLSIYNGPQSSLWVALNKINK